MSGNVIEEFLVGLGFQFEGEEGERFKKQTQQIASVINTISAAAAAATSALFLMSKQQGQNAYNMATTAKVMDTSVQSLGRWRYAAERAGTSGDSVVSMLQGLKTMSQEALRNGNGPFRAFEELGVDFQGIADGSVDVSKALEDILATAQSLDRATAQAGLRELGIDPVLLDTSVVKLREFMTEYERYAHMTDTLAQKGGELDVAMAGSMVRWEGIQNMMSERLIPTYVKFFEVLSEGFEWVQETGLPIMDEFVEELGGWDKVLGGLALLAIPAVIGAMTTLLKLLGLVTGGLGGATAAAAGLARGGVAVGAAWGGYELGKSLREGREELSYRVGDFLAQGLTFLGLEEGKDFHREWETDADKEQQERDRRANEAAYPEYTSNSDLMDAIIGKESGGRTGLTSNKGAMGLAQLMPDTARQMAAELGIGYDPDKLLNDGAYNRTLGEAYLSKMLKRYGGNQTLATAAYNAGPGSVDKWLGANGDPRMGGISERDWIQAIPYKETRDYTYEITRQMAAQNPLSAQPEGPGSNPLSAPGAGSRSVTNHFHGLKQSEIEELLRNAEQEQSTLFADETRDTMVR